jgi:hypothetical protein
MQAMNGFGVLGIRRMCRIVGCVAALVALSAMTVPSIASAHKKAKPISATYLGLGDSLAFGYSKQLFNENEGTFENPTGFEHGFVNDYYAMLNKKGNVQMVNDGCPGETSASLIGTKAAGELNTLLKGHIPEPVTGEKPCAYHTEDGLPLHHEYGGEKSQLESAIETVQQGTENGKPVKVITLDIGANDQLHEIAKIEAEVGARQQKKVEGIVTVEVEQAIVGKVNAVAEAEVAEFVLGKAIEQAETEPAGSQQEFEEHVAKDAAEYVATHAGELFELQLFDGAVYAAEHEKELGEEAAKLGAQFAGEYLATHGAELAAEGKEIAKEEIEATAGEVGEQIITNTIAVMSALDGNGFAGRFIFVGTYDAFGRVFEGQGEELEGSNALLAALGTSEKKAFGAAPFKACYANEQAKFNVDAGGAGNAAQEVKNMDEWTNQANFTKTGSKANGPDIHATPLGYEKMAEQIKANCKAKL